MATQEFVSAIRKNKNKTLILNDDDYNVAYVMVVFKIFFAVSETAKI